MRKVHMLLCLVIVASSATGCATLFAAKQSDIFIAPEEGAQLPADLKVTVDGQPTNLSPASSSADAILASVLPPGTKVIAVDRRHEATIALTGGGQTASYVATTSASVGWFLLDLFTTGPIGIIVDWSTHAWASHNKIIIRFGAPATARNTPAARRLNALALHAGAPGQPHATR